MSPYAVEILSRHMSFHRLFSTVRVVGEMSKACVRARSCTSTFLSFCNCAHCRMLLLVRSRNRVALICCVRCVHVRASFDIAVIP